METTLETWDATPSDMQLEPAPRPEPTGGIYDLPIVGGPARRTRQFFDEMAPVEGDSPGTEFGKQVIRYGTVAAVGTVGVAVGAMVAL
ncbi:MAG TPA: hypothetical protein VHC43_10560 [Mycobacteriales bacterium]|nr:hypothetical protein [Mycobacteriales bacterium]